MGKALKGCAIGCLVTIVLAGIAAFIGFRLLVAYFGPSIGNITGTGGEVAQIMKEVGGMDAFSPPEDRVMKEQRFLDFLEIRERTMQQVDSFVSWVNSFENREPGLKDILRFLDEIGKIFLARAQGLRDKQMSLGEYSWYFQQVAQLVVASEMKDMPERVYGIIDGAEVMLRIQDFSDRIAALESEGGKFTSSSDFSEGWEEFRDKIKKDREAFLQTIRAMPEQNLELVRKYRQRILNTAVLFLFGM